MWLMHKAGRGALLTLRNVGDNQSITKRRGGRG